MIQDRRKNWDTRHREGHRRLLRVLGLETRRRVNVTMGMIRLLLEAPRPGGIL